MNKTNQRRRGRPPSPADSIKRESIGIRLRTETKKWLDACAAKNTRSISEEMQYLAERARYDDEQYLPTVQNLAREMMNAFAGGLVPGPFDHPEAFEGGMIAVWRLLLGKHPEFTPAAEERLRTELTKAFARADAYRQIAEEDAREATK